jgi:CBS domain containing-hemolysin-like protein
MTHSAFLSDVLVWIGIAFCITQSAIFSGLNLAIFSISKLRLEVEAAGGNRDALGLLALRKDSNLTLATVLWGNVTINVLLTLLSDSVLAGVGAFVFSTIVITLFGEIFPQAYFVRNALRMGARLAPVLKLYQLGLIRSPSQRR